MKIVYSLILMAFFSAASHAMTERAESESAVKIMQEAIAQNSYTETSTIDLAIYEELNYNL